MKTLFLITFLLFSAITNAKTYYLSSSGNDNNKGVTTAAAWNSITKINSFTFAQGDSILFQRGNTFYGSVVANNNNLNFGAYGTGANPIITGFTTLTSWTNSGGGIWSSNVSAASSSLIAVSIDGKLQQIGRYPNTGYLTYTALNSTGPTITGSALSATTNWTGAEVVIRKQHWIIDRCRVTAHSGGVVSYTNPATVNTYFGKVGYGYFFQDDIRTLDQQGEWFLNKSTKDLSVYFGTNNPASYNIKVSTLDALFNCGGFNELSRSGISVENITFEGANETALLAANGSAITVKNCSFNNNNNAVYIYNTSNSITDGNTVTNTLNNGIDQLAAVSSNTTITNNTIRNCGMFAGMGKSGDGMYCGIQQSGNNATIEYNRIDSIGYNALQFQNSNISVRYNYVTNFCMTKDDGGGIYTWSGNGTYTNRVVQNNIVMNAQGAPLGTEGSESAHCIYLDGHAMNVDVLNNTLSGAMASGLFLNNASTIKTTGNTIFNVPISYNLNRMPGEPLLRNNSFTKNISYPTLSNFFYWNGELNTPVTNTIQNDIKAIFVSIDSNYYRNDITAPFDWYYHLTSGGTFVDPPSLSLTSWQSFKGSDNNSKIISGTVIFKYNPSKTAKTFTLDAKYLGVDSIVYNGSITLQPFSSAALIKNGPITIPVKADAGTNINLSLPTNFTTLKGTVTGTAITFNWSKVLGPSQFTIVSPNSLTTDINNLVAGKYTFQLKVKGSSGDTSLAIVNIVVSSVLPVKLLDFSAKNDNGKLILQWQTASELNVSHYIIQRSANGQNFENIGQVNSNNLFNTKCNYKFADNLPLQDVSFYRLAMVDKDGTIIFSKTISVAVKDLVSFTVSSIAISSANNIKIRLNSNCKQAIGITLIDVNGRLIYSTSVQLQNGFNTIDNKIPFLNTGVYYAKLITNNLSITKSILGNL
jgi:hypothetical protein